MKLIKIFLISILLTTTLFAKDYNFGVKVGGTYSTEDILAERESEAGLTSYYWGTFLSFHYNKPLYKLFSIQLEINLNQKGHEKIATEYKKESNVTLQVLEFVALSKFKFKYIKPFIGGFYSVTLFSGAPFTDYGYTLGFELYHKEYSLDFRFNKSFGYLYDRRDQEDRYAYYNSKQFVLSFGYNF